MARRILAVGSLLVCAVALTACEASKSSNPLSPSVAGPIPGINITAPSTVDPQNGVKIAMDKQPVTLSISNAGSNGPRPLNYLFEIATDANFNTKVFTRDSVTPGTNGKTTLTLPDPLATGHTYFWRTRAQDGANTGPYSSVASFTVFTPIVINDPVLVSPAALAVVDSIRPAFVVTDAVRSGPAGAISYLVEVADSDSFANKITWTAPEQATQTTLNTPSDLAYAKTYFWHVRAYDPTTLGPFSPTRAFTTPAAPVVVAPTPVAGGAANDAVNLGLATVYNSPQDVASWPATATITRLDLGTGGVHVDFTKKDGVGSWPDVPFGAPGDSLEYTLWIVLNINGRWYTSGCIEFWRGLDRNGGPPSAYGQNWYYDPIRWGVMAGYQPQPGEMVGFFVTSGDQRNNGAFKIKERSNVVLVPFPSGSGVFPF
ncbi:MAG TPA: hypothetical protein VGH34_12985 [Vicinamibacterales bacterium]